MEKRHYYITPHDYEIAELNGINQGALDQRVRDYGWDIERAITEPLKVEIPFHHIWEKWEQVATEKGISKDLFYHRIRAYGWSEEEAGTLPKGRRNSKWTTEELEIAERNGVRGNGMSLPNARLRLGWSREDAIGTPKLTEEERVKRVAAGVKKYYEERGVNREFNKTR